MQANKVGDLDLSITPRGGVIWYPVEKLSVKGLYSQAFRAPRINELYMNYGNSLFGNENLEPEKVSTLDIGIGYQAEQAQFGVDFFYSKQLKNIQYLPTDTNAFVTIYQNVADVTFIGGEFEGKYYINKNLYLNASMLYQTNKNDSVENLVPIPNFSAKAGVSYMSDNGITVGLFNIYQGELDDKFEAPKNTDYQGAYDLLHLHSNFNINKLFNLQFKPELELFLNIDNILDKEVFLWDLGSTGVVIPKIPGRAIYFGIKASL
jgi:outer membrane receptor protein involved in Fe transport